MYRHPSSYRKHVNSDHYERRHELTLDATAVFHSEKKDADLLPSKQYARIFGKDGYMEISSSPDTAHGSGSSGKASPTGRVIKKMEISSNIKYWGVRL